MASANEHPRSRKPNHGAKTVAQVELVALKLPMQMHMRACADKITRFNFSQAQDPAACLTFYFPCNGVGFGVGTITASDSALSNKILSTINIQQLTHFSVLRQAVLVPVFGDRLSSSNCMAFSPRLPPTPSRAHYAWHMQPLQPPAFYRL